MQPGTPIRILAFSNGVAAVVMPAWAYPFGLPGTAFGRIGRGHREAGEGTA